VFETFPEIIVQNARVLLQKDRRLHCREGGYQPLFFLFELTGYLVKRVFHAGLNSKGCAKGQKIKLFNDIEVIEREDPRNEQRTLQIC
jgi:hypothetical protein